MATTITPAQGTTPPAGTTQAVQATSPAKKKHSGAWLRNAGHSFATSSYVTTAWEWFLGFAARAVQPILFFTVMYNLASTYPGFESPGPKIDLAIFIAQNAALDIGSFGLPALADQAEEAGKAEAAAGARKVAKWLFVVMIANLIWGGIEHSFTNIDDGWKTGVALVFVIIRAYFAAEYMRVLHRLGKHDAATAPAQTTMQPEPNEVQLALQSVQTKQTELHEEVQALQGTIADRVQSGVRVQIIELREELVAAMPVQITELREELVAAIPAALPSVDEEDCTEIQIFLPSLENTAPEVHRRHRELLHMLSITEEPQSSLPEPAAPHRNAVQHLAWPDALSETEPHTGALSAVQPDAADASQGGFKEKIFAYVQAEITQGHEPTAQEIMDEVHCKQRTAFKYKAEALIALQAK